MNNWSYINYINAKIVKENITKNNSNYYINVGPLFGYNNDNIECSLFLTINEKLHSDYDGCEVIDLINALNKDNWHELLINGCETYKPGIDYKFSDSLYDLIQKNINESVNNNDTFVDTISNRNINGSININVGFNQDKLYNNIEYNMEIDLTNCDESYCDVEFYISESCIVNDVNGNRLFTSGNNIIEQNVKLTNRIYNYTANFILNGIYNYEVIITNKITGSIMGYKYGEINILDNGNREKYCMPDYLIYYDGNVSVNYVDYSNTEYDTYTAVSNLKYYEKLNLLANSNFSKEELDNFYLTFCNFIKTNTELDIYTENNYIYLNVLNYFANGSSDSAQTGIYTILGSVYGTISSNSYSSCGCNNGTSTSNDRTCLDLYKTAMLEYLKKMLGDVKFYEDWFFMKNGDDANILLVDGLLSMIDGFLSLEYSLNFDKSIMSKCNCEAIESMNNCNKETILNYKKVLNWIRNNEIEENTNKIKVYGEAFGELLPNLQF